MKFTCTLMSEEDARAICSWRYEGQYAVYNLGNIEDAVKEMLDRRSPHYAVRDERGELVGFYAFGSSATVEDNVEPGLYAENNHALRVKVAANAIAECEQLEEDTKGKALTAALIHDLGKLLLAWQMPQEYMKVRHIMEGGMSCIQAEQVVFQGDHAQVGSWVLGLWGLPDAVTKAVALQHDPTILNSPELDAAVVVNASDLMVHQCDSLKNTAALVPPSQLISTPWESKYPFWAEAFLKSKQEWAASPELSRATAV